MLRLIKRKPSKLPPLPKNWHPGHEFNQRSYVLYECGCNYHKVWKDDDTFKKLKWCHCDHHTELIDRGREMIHKGWEDIFHQPISKEFSTAPPTPKVPPPLPPLPPVLSEEKYSDVSLSEIKE